MGVQFCEGNPTFTAGAALPLYANVKLASGVLQLAGATDYDAIGTVQREAFASGDLVPVRLHHANGTHLMIASAAIAVNAVVNQAASGKVQTGAGDAKRGIAKTAATANGDYIEVIPIFTIQNA
jgi:hypothetical protein